MTHGSLRHGTPLGGMNVSVMPNIQRGVSLLTLYDLQQEGEGITVDIFREHCRFQGGGDGTARDGTAQKVRGGEGRGGI